LPAKDKIVYSTEVDISIDNGPGINEREFINALLEKYSDQITCIIPYPKYPNEYFNSKIDYIFRHQFSPFRYPIYLAALLIKILKVNRNHNIRALVFRMGAIPLVPWVLARTVDKPVFLKTLAGYYLFEKEPRKFVHRIVASISFPIYKFVIQKAQAADTVSNAYTEWLHYKFGINKEKLALIRNGVNTRLFFPQDKHSSRQKIGLDRFEKVIGYVGALDALRHVEDLIYSMRNIDNLRKTCLVLVGAGPDRNRLQNLVSSIGLERNVIFKGFVSYKDVPTYITAFDVAVDLSLIPMQVAEKTIPASYSQKIPQYLSCGVPVIAWDTVDTRFLKQRKIGEVVPHGETEKLSKAINKCLHESLREKVQITQRCREYALEHFSVEVLTEKRMRLWQKALDTDKLRLKNDLS